VTKLNTALAALTLLRWTKQ